MGFLRRRRAVPPCQEQDPPTSVPVVAPDSGVPSPETLRELHAIQQAFESGLRQLQQLDLDPVILDRSVRKLASRYDEDRARLGIAPPERPQGVTDVRPVDVEEVRVVEAEEVSGATLSGDANKSETPPEPPEPVNAHADVGADPQSGTQCEERD